MKTHKMEKNMHKALYRIYRPTSFKDIVGQDQIIQILKNQIQENSISHAYIFSGGRGTGKTSTAKVFAKAVNCTQLENQEPCHKCKQCTQAEIDIIEIDAASNNSVDNIREIRENVVYTPTYGKYKIYIIDEVHMLSHGAFNALLKTLEEPPAHVIFILATTEPQKIPETVLSRCQRFDFKKIESNIIIERLVEILKELNLTYEEEALSIIAQKSDGAMRDALSLLDKAIAFKELTYDNVLYVIGELSYKEFHTVIEAIKSKNTVAILEQIQTIESNGKDLKMMVKDFISYLRDMMIYKSQALNLLHHSEDEMNALMRSCDLIDIEEIVELIEIMSDLEAKTKYSPKPKILIEACFIKITKTTISTQNVVAIVPDKIEELARKIEELEMKLTNLEKRGNIPTEKIVKYQEERRKKTQLPYIDDIAIQANIDENEKNNIEQIKIKMNDVSEILRQQKNVHLKALLKEGEPVRYIGDCIYVGYDDNFAFHKQTIETPLNTEQIADAFSKVLQKKVKVAFIFKREMRSIINSETEDKDKQIIEQIKSIFPDVPLEIRESEE